MARGRQRGRIRHSRTPPGEAQGVLTRHVLSLNRIRREEVEAMRGQAVPRRP